MDRRDAALWILKKMADLMLYVSGSKKVSPEFSIANVRNIAIASNHGLEPILRTPQIDDMLNYSRSNFHVIFPTSSSSFRCEPDSRTPVDL